MHLRYGEFNQDKTLGLFEAVGKNSKEQGFALIRSFIWNGLRK